MKLKTILTLSSLLLAGMALTGCAYMNGGVEQYVIEDKICTAVWYNSKIVWSKYRTTDTPKDTLSKDSIKAASVYKTIKTLK